MTDYNARIDLNHPAPAGHDDPFTDTVLTALEGFSPAVSRGMHGGTTLDFTIPANDLKQATTLALSLATTATTAELVGLEVIPTVEFDRRNGTHMPALLSVSETAERLGISRQAVLQRIESGNLVATKVGSTWVIPEATAPAVGRSA
ncbi:helix-turn-helix domain-containing protein [Cellulomonas sp.]|uniref:helix-turn-helix domain-containing protein n=1 Tax=Cellulomonas sp. TaxID=40001 RepID=UPI00258D2E0C|nr:helix-turn-helix domain-containing protein [Cellulomonas sp.]MCR6688104.1 helix-turn-helix domain-containing protein [Cellulomonas sp.]